MLKYKQMDRDSMREMLVIKMKLMHEEKQKQLKTLANADALSNLDDVDNSIEDADMNKTGELSKLSNKDSVEKSKENNLDLNKSALSAANSMTSIAMIPERDNLDGDFKPVIIELWRDLAKNYKGQMNRIFRFIRVQREQTRIRTADLKMQFLEFLHTSDGKQDILDDFVKEFNKFSDEYPDLREDEQTKEELHQRTDSLSDELWEIVEERKEQSIEFRKKVMDSGFIEFSLEFLTGWAQQLMQAEVDKFKTSIQILQDYYHAVEEKLIPEAPPAQMVDIVFPDGEEPPEVEKLPEGSDNSKAESYSYPRLDRLLAMAIKQQVVPDVTQVTAAADNKKGGAKKPDKKGAAVQEEEKSVEESIFVREMREAIKVE